MDSPLAHAAPFIIAAGYAAVVGVLANVVIKLNANYHAKKDHGIDATGATPDNFTAFALWAVDFSQVITTAIISPLFAAASGLVFSTAIALLFVGTLVVSVWLCILIATHDPPEYVNWASNWINEKTEKSVRGVQPTWIVRCFIHVATDIGVTWPTITQLLAAGVAALVAATQPNSARNHTAYLLSIPW